MRKTFGYIGLGFFIVLLLLIYAMSYSDIPVHVLEDKYANAHSQFIEINGQNVHYRIEGQGPNLLLLHGTAASLHTWDGWTESLKKEFRVIRLDLPAFGLTGPSPEGDYSINAYTEFLKEFSKVLDLEQFSIAGNSLGGGIAWAYAAKYPDQVEKLILINSSGIPVQGSDPAVFKLARNPILGKLMEFVTPKSFIKKNMKEVYFDDKKVTDSLISRYHEMALRTGNRKAFRQRAEVVNPDITDQLSNISAPTLILWGEQDEWIPVENAYIFQRKIPMAQIAILQNLGHVPMEEDPKTTSSLAKEFLLH